MKTEPFGPLDPSLYREVVRRALAEDLGWGDATTDATVAPEQRARAALRALDACVIAGIEVALEAFRQLDPGVQSLVRHADGATCAAGAVVADIEGHAQSLLTAAHVAVSLLRRLSSIATLTRRLVDAAGGQTPLADAWDTTPLFRALEKYAVRAGGGINHPLSLDARIAITSHHARLAGGVGEALRRARAAEAGLAIEVEVRSLDDVDQALANGAPRLVAVRMPPGDLEETVRRARGRAQVEAAVEAAEAHVKAAVGAGVDLVSADVFTGASAVRIVFELLPS